MFLRRYVRTKAGKQHTYFALVDSVRTDIPDWETAGARRYGLECPISGCRSRLE